MTDPIDDTQPHTTPDPTQAPSTPLPVAPIPAAPGPLAVPPVLPDPVPEPDPEPEPPGEAPDPAPDSERFASEPPLRADPDRPADPGWREPAWIPARERERRPSPAAIVFGLALIGVGLWFFLDRTLGVALPRVQWSTIWPVILIVIGGLILLRSFQRRA